MRNPLSLVLLAQSIISFSLAIRLLRAVITTLVTRFDRMRTVHTEIRCSALEEAVAQALGACKTEGPPGDLIVSANTVHILEGWLVLQSVIGIDAYKYHICMYGLLRV